MLPGPRNILVQEPWRPRQRHAKPARPPTDKPTEAFLDHLGLGERYRTDSGCGIYTVESHLCFSKSVRAGAVLLYDSQLLGCDEKRLHVFHRMSQSPAGDVVATNELMFLHVDIASERVTPMPPERCRAASQSAKRERPRSLALLY